MGKIRSVAIELAKITSKLLKKQLPFKHAFLEVFIYEFKLLNINLCLELIIVYSGLH